VILGYLLASTETSNRTWPLIAFCVVLAVLVVGRLALSDYSIGHIRRVIFRVHHSRPGLSGGLGIVYTPGPNSPSRSLEVRDTTRGRVGYLLETPFRPTAVDVELPTRQRFTPERLPGFVWCGSGKLWIKTFKPKGVVIDEEGTVGDAFQMFVHD
jgi:hypothetical protein